MTLFFYLCPIKICDILRFVTCSVADPDQNSDPDLPDLHVFGPSGSRSRSNSQRYGSGPGSGSESFFHQTKIVIQTFIRTAFWLFIFENDANVPSKSNKQLKLEKKLFLLASWRSMTEIAGSGSSSRYISQRHGSVDPDPHQNVMGPQQFYLNNILLFLDILNC